MADYAFPKNVSASFQRLSAAATQLNAVSDELGKSITALDLALKKLNLGISAWVQISRQTDPQDGSFSAHFLGYAKIGSKWGIALSITEGNEFTGDFVRDEEWLFNDAPRALRVEAVEKLPELLEGLITEANTTAERIKDKIGHAQQVAQAITRPGASDQAEALSGRNAQQAAQEIKRPRASDQVAALRETPNEQRK